jgi:hypothetical protein
MAKRSSSQLPVPASESRQGITLPIDPVTGIGLVAAIAIAGLIGGVLWAALGVAVSAVVVNLLARQAESRAAGRQHQDVMAQHLLRGAMPEDIATLMLAGDVASKNVFEFLEAIKHEYGGESTDGDQRKPGPDQLDAVSPGIQLTLSHDLGVWYALLHFKGATGKRYLQGGYAQWKGRGATPAEAIDNVIRKAAQSRQQVLIQDYAARMVAEAD